ncbi:hypothetical protein LGN19_09530 [Burkholderia sp. AU30198]|uniref:hypothetical protein n=1 Tax=Burkholderia sp. AU30198 TaxID=2879627 RepID=UPI001CF2B9B2|nr:hypothetical protein [Burkholderia sp. AU30198]MCA8294033.1 hypothetical protein [Burkholderia sp. AU30198]
MPPNLPIGANDYYDSNPETQHSAGDIWVNLPTYGLLGMRRRAGIVITPPCDLAQGKVETITYLPIISLSSYFSTSAFLPVVMRELRGQLTTLNIGDLATSNGRFSPPPIDTIIRTEVKLNDLTSDTKTGLKEKSAAEKSIACIEILKKIHDGELSECDAKLICNALGTKSAKTLYENIIKNSHSIDLHFLPKDNQPIEWSAIDSHSLVLFRYPITAPVDLFDEAQEIATRDWHSSVAKVAKKVPAAAAFAEIRPMKRAVLKSGFFADLLTRYAAMHVRVGSPDFTQTTIGNYISDLGFPK